jgi:hypothetical protein
MILIAVVHSHGEETGCQRQAPAIPLTQRTIPHDWRSLDKCLRLLQKPGDKHFIV